jgi:hypothetical protein
MYTTWQCPGCQTYASVEHDRNVGDPACPACGHTFADPRLARQRRAARIGPQYSGVCAVCLTRDVAVIGIYSTDAGMGICGACLSAAAGELRKALA